MNTKKIVYNGVKWTSGASIILALISVIKLSILARFIEKYEFGLLAQVTFILSFCELFNDLGLSAALIHKRELKIKDLSSLYWLNLFFSIFLFIIILIITPVYAHFYKELELIKLLPILGSTILISTIGRQYRTLLVKEMNFKIISLIEITGALLSAAVSIWLAIKGMGVYALVYSIIINTSFNHIFYFIMGNNKYPLLRHFSFNDVKPYIRIGAYSTGGQIVNYFNKEIDILIIGKMFGSEILGSYSLAKQLVYKPFAIVNPILVKIATPLFAKIQSSSKELKESYLKLISIVSSINFITYTSLCLLAKPIVFLLYGASYTDAVIIVQLLSVYMYFISVKNPVSTITIASGRTDLELFLSVLTFFVTPIFVYFASFISIELVSVSLILALILLFIPMWYFVIRVIIGVDFTTYLKSHIPKFGVLYYAFAGLIKK